MSRINVIVTVLVLLIISAIAAVAWCIHATGERVRNAYASDWTAVFVMEHLRNNDCVWPTGWHDLKDEFDKMAEPNHYAWTFEELQHRVILDWQVDIASLATADPPQKVFQLSDGTEARYGDDPNVLIRDYVATHCHSKGQADQ